MDHFSVIYIGDYNIPSLPNSILPTMKNHKKNNINASQNRQCSVISGSGEIENTLRSVPALLILSVFQTLEQHNNIRLTTNV